MSYFVKKQLPLYIGTLLGLLIIGAYFLDIKALSDFKGIATNWVVLISAISVAMGFTYMTNAQIKMYQRKKSTVNLIYLALPYLTFAAFILSGVLYKDNISSPEYLWWYSTIYQNVGATIYAVMYFTLASSAYRTFIVSSVDAIALLIGGMVYTLRQIPLFQVYIPWIVPFGEWILLVPNVGGGRGPVITAAIAALVVGIRTLWGKDVGLGTGGTA